MTLNELASELGISKAKCSKAIQDGLLPFAVCIPPEDKLTGKNVFLIPTARFKKWQKGEFVG